LHAGMFLPDDDGMTTTRIRRSGGRR
jgi:hypothetical protein